MAFESKTDICNLAMDLLSAGTVLNIEIPTDATSSLLNRWYDHSRRRILREYVWKFAIKRDIIAASSTAPAFGYAKAYSLPNDYIRVVRVESDEGVRIPSENYEIESHEGVKSILINSDATQLRLVYVYDIEDVTKFDDMFVSYLALTIALSLAYKVTESNGSVERVAQLEKRASAMARAISGQEKPPLVVETSNHLNARKNRGSRISHRIIF